jgi:hypothetical protein
MSTFKRLVNLGKGKIKSATSSSPSPAVAPDRDDWITDARHRAADAADALADALRPGGDAEPDQPTARPVTDPKPTAEPEAPSSAPTGSVKKTL